MGRTLRGAQRLLAGSRLTIVKMIVGLGNPGRQYDRTRHNVGFLVIDTLGRRSGEPKASMKRKAFVAQVTIRSQPVMLVKPQTFMNDSGDSVGPLAQYFKIDLSDILVISDDVDLPFGRLRLRSHGSAGGHNGLRSIFVHLGTDAVPRLKVGVGRSSGPSDTRDYVLAPFTTDESIVLSTVLDHAADAVESVVSEGLIATMNLVNGTPPS